MIGLCKGQADVFNCDIYVRILLVLHQEMNESQHNLLCMKLGASLRSKADIRIVSSS